MRKFLKSNFIIIVLILGIIWVFFAPYFLTRFTIVSFSSTGQIGDTIGGITAPAIGLISAILLYVALLKQIESNNYNKHESNFKYINSEIEKFESEIKNYNFGGQFGYDSILSFSISFKIRFISGKVSTDDYSTLENFEFLINRFHKLFYLLDKMDTSLDYKDLLYKDINQLYRVYFGLSCSHINGWNLDKISLETFIYGKALSIQSFSKVLSDEIIKRKVK